MRYILGIFFQMIILGASAQSDEEEKILLKAVRSGDLETISGFLARGFDVNGYYGKNKDKTLLHIAIDAREAESARFLILNGADIEKRSDGDITPLMEAAINNQLEIAHLLLDLEVQVNATTASGNTALFFAAKYGTLRLNRLLIQRGAVVTLQNNRRLKPVDYAISANKDTIVNYLKTMEVRWDSALRIPDYLDGPHVIWDHVPDIYVIYFFRDSLTNQTLFIDKHMEKSDSVIRFKGYKTDTNDYLVYRHPFHDEHVFDNVQKIFVIGDLHGQYDTLVKILTTNNIIDKDLNWNWDNGHLLFIGDMVDRGDRVTECLWLIYKLERQAIDAGGYVHFILGNHEIMNMMDEMQYNHEKYQFFSGYFDVNYSRFFAPDAILGKWLRSKNTMIRINDILFIHGGISSQMLALHLDIDSVNHIIRQFLNQEYNPIDRENLNLLLYTFGPFWYRGYFKIGDLPPETTQEQIDRILAFYNVSQMVIGHTDVKYIVPIYQKKVIPIDIPFHDKEYHQQSLLIENGLFYRIYPDGHRVLLK